MIDDLQKDKNMSIFMHSKQHSPDLNPIENRWVRIKN